LSSFRSGVAWWAERIADVAAWQYVQREAFLAGDLAKASASRVRWMSLPESAGDPVRSLSQINDLAELDLSPVSPRFARDLPRINALKDSWRLRFGAEAERALDRHAGRIAPDVV
jgi:hypothetical protein